MEDRARSKFLEVVCSRCGNKQMIFGKSSIKVKCLKCNKLLVRVTGGKTRVKAIIKGFFR